MYAKDGMTHELGVANIRSQAYSYLQRVVICIERDNQVSHGADGKLGVNAERRVCVNEHHNLLILLLLDAVSKPANEGAQAAVDSHVGDVRVSAGLIGGSSQTVHEGF